MLSLLVQFFRIMKPNEKFKELRQDKGLLQKDIAKICGIARTTYSAYEQGTAEADYKTLQTLAKFYGITIDVLLGNDKQDLITMTKEQYNSIIEANETLTDIIKSIYQNKNQSNKTQIIIGNNNNNNTN
jgi:transcriptional regulator with XRE-family HTH domain